MKLRLVNTTLLLICSLVINAESAVQQTAECGPLMKRLFEARSRKPRLQALADLESVRQFWTKEQQTAQCATQRAEEAVRLGGSGTNALTTPARESCGGLRESFLTQESPDGYEQSLLMYCGFARIPDQADYFKQKEQCLEELSRAEGVAARSRQWSVADYQQRLHPSARDCELPQVTSPPIERARPVSLLIQGGQDCADCRRTSQDAPDSKTNQDIQKRIAPIAASAQLTGKLQDAIEGSSKSGKGKSGKPPQKETTSNSRQASRTNAEASKDGKASATDTRAPVAMAPAPKIPSSFNLAKKLNPRPADPNAEALRIALDFSQALRAAEQELSQDPENRDAVATPAELAAQPEPQPAEPEPQAAPDATTGDPEIDARALAQKWQEAVTGELTDERLKAPRARERGEFDTYADALMQAWERGEKPAFNPAEFFLQQERLEQVKKVGPEAAQKSYESAYRKWATTKIEIETILKETPGLDAKQKLQLVVDALKSAEMSVYLRDKANLGDYYQGSDPGGNCEAQTKLMWAEIQSLGLELPQGWVLGAQMYQDHLQPVLLNQKQDQIVELVSGKFQDLKKAATIFDPMTLVQAYRNTQGKGGDIPWSKFILRQGALKGGTPNLALTNSSLSSGMPRGDGNYMSGPVPERASVKPEPLEWNKPSRTDGSVGSDSSDSSGGKRSTQGTDPNERGSGGFGNTHSSKGGISLDEGSRTILSALARLFNPNAEAPNPFPYLVATSLPELKAKAKDDILYYDGRTVFNSSNLKDDLLAAFQVVSQKQLRRWMSGLENSTSETYEYEDSRAAVVFRDSATADRFRALPSVSDRLQFLKDLQLKRSRELLQTSEHRQWRDLATHPELFATLPIDQLKARVKGTMTNGIARLDQRDLVYQVARRGAAELPNGIVIEKQSDLESYLNRKWERSGKGSNVRQLKSNFWDSVTYEMLTRTPELKSITRAKATLRLAVERNPEKFVQFYKSLAPSRAEILMEYVYQMDSEAVTALDAERHERVAPRDQFGVLQRLSNRVPDSSVMKYSVVKGLMPFWLSRRVEVRGSLSARAAVEPQKEQTAQEAQRISLAQESLAGGKNPPQASVTAPSSVMRLTTPGKMQSASTPSIARSAQKSSEAVEEDSAVPRLTGEVWLAPEAKDPVELSLEQFSKLFSHSIREYWNYQSEAKRVEPQDREYLKRLFELYLYRSGSLDAHDYLSGMFSFSWAARQKTLTRFRQMAGPKAKGWNYRSPTGEPMTAALAKKILDDFKVRCTAASGQEWNQMNQGLVERGTPFKTAEECVKYMNELSSQLAKAKP